MTQEEWINVREGAEVYLQPNTKGVCVKAVVLVAFHDKRKDGAKIRIYTQDVYGNTHTEDRFMKRVELLTKPIDPHKIPQGKYAYRLQGTEQLVPLAEIKSKHPNLSRGIVEHALRTGRDVEGEFYERVQLTMAGTIYRVIPPRGATA